MGKALDLTNQTFGRLTARKKTNKRKNNSIVWKCECKCGNFCEVDAGSLRALRTRSCGCLKKESDKKPKGNVKNEKGNIYGHLTVIERAGSDKNGQAKWLCKCDCEAKTRIIVSGSNLRTGHTTSCGCERRSRGELAVAKILNENNISYIQEYQAFKFSNNRWATFDFYIDNKYLIEYDGETHYQYNLHGWHDESQLKAQQERDIIKNKWCKDNNIPLIRIPYTHLDNLNIEDLQIETSKFIIN